ncbi:MAG: thioredoxin reductase (NADPH) [Halieaceae bacterium]|jgi:thioredoxin reductase (NADPH)
MNSVIETDALIVGAGPVGLFQVFELGLLDIKAHVIETLEKPGGQCSELYPDKPIYDIPALPRVSAQELTDRLLEQIKPFEPQFHFGHEVQLVERIDEEWFRVATDRGLEFKTRAIIIAAGMGSFHPVRVKVAGLDSLEGKSVFYQIRDPELHRGKDVVVLGGGDSALDWTLALQPIANSVTLIHRSSRFRAAPASVKKLQGLADQLKLQYTIGSVSDYATHSDGSLAQIKVTGGDGVTRTHDLDHLLVFFGQSPKLGPIANWGLDLHKNQIKVDTEKFQSSRDGIYAVGDINYYPGKKKLILSGFHEAALAAFAIKARIQPEKKVYLQYTTTSPVMHERLGVTDPYADDEAA